ncbi:MAG: dicarboxylate/amino acid:cation symporter [Polyangia bacterium]
MTDVPPRRPLLSQSQLIILGLMICIVAGALVWRFAPGRADLFRPFASLFLRLIKMIVAPLIFSSLVAGIGGASANGRRIGRMGFRAIVYFEVVTALALVVGLAAVNLTHPGVGVQLPPPTGDAPPVSAHPQSWDEILLHAVPESIVLALAQNDVLQIVIFALAFGIAVGRIGDKGKPIVAFMDSVTEAMFTLTNGIMHYAPVGVGAAIAYTVGKGGLGILWHLASLVGTLYAALVVFLVAVLLPVALLARVPLRRFLRAIKEPALIAFSTASSEAALPRAMETIEELGVPRPIVAFILPLGYSFNLDGSTLYLSLASIFVAQAAGVHLSAGQQATMLLTLMLTSKGVAGVARASLVVLAATLGSYHLPLEGVTLILGVDTLMDMARTTVNVIGNCLATVVVARWEGEKV